MKRKAFTLIELAIVLTIVGLMIGGSFKLLKYQREKTKINEAKEVVLSAKSAIIGNTLLNDNTLPEYDYFDENLSPVINDKHPLMYIYEQNLTLYNACAIHSTGLEVDTPDKNISNVAFIVVSESANYNMQTAYSSGVVTLHSPSEKVDDNTTPINRPEDYDDVYQWVTLSELKEAVGCNEKPLKFLNDRLPHAEVNATYEATLYVENNISAVDINCTPASDPDHNISYDSVTMKFTGDVNASGTSLRTCVATESLLDRNVTKQYVITIDP